MSAVNLIAQLADCAASLAPARESITVGAVVFVIDDSEDYGGDVWFRNRKSPVCFCRNANESADRAWYCSLGNEAAFGATPQEAFGIALTDHAEALLKLVESKVAS